jgi:site-specific DNA recombinase
MIGIYARQSNEDASRYSISSQIEAAKAKANILYPNEICKDYVDDGYSGEFLDRPGLTQLRNDVKDGLIQAVVCFDPDRLSRKLMNQLILSDEFERRKVSCIFVNGDYAKTPEGNLFYSMRGAISEFEKAKITERMSRGRVQKAKAGKIVKEPHMYGYKVVDGNFVIDEEEAAIVRLIFDLFTTPKEIEMGINGIAKYLMRHSIPTKKGGDMWHRQVVRQILRNETYTGVFYQNKWNCEGMIANRYLIEDKVKIKMRPKKDWIALECPQIISEFQFNQAQRIIDESRRRFAKQAKRQYLLSGLVRCGTCGNTMTGRYQKNWGKFHYEYQDKKLNAGAKNVGCGRVIRSEVIEPQVWNTFMSWLNNPEEIANIKEENKTTFEENELNRIEVRLTKIQDERKRVLQLFKSNLDIGEELIREEFESLKTEEESLRNQKAKMEKEIEFIKNARNTQNLLQEAIDYYSKIEELSFDHKKNLLRYVIKQIIVHDDEIEIITF